MELPPGCRRTVEEAIPPLLRMLADEAFEAVVPEDRRATPLPLLPGGWAEVAAVAWRRALIARLDIPPRRKVWVLTWAGAKRIGLESLPRDPWVPRGKRGAGSGDE